MFKKILKKFNVFLFKNLGGQNQLMIYNLRKVFKKSTISDQRRHSINILSYIKFLSIVYKINILEINGKKITVKLLVSIHNNFIETSDV